MIVYDYYKFLGISYLVCSGNRRTRDAINADAISVDWQSRVWYDNVLIRADK